MGMMTGRRSIMRALPLLSGLGWWRPGRAEVPQAVLDQAAGWLARAIETARVRAIADGVRPVPAGVQRGLSGYFPTSLLHRARYGVQQETRIFSLPNLAFGYGDADAITLIDVVMFRDAGTASQDLVLWAHELTHVMQYERWGTLGFAERYVRDHEVVEREARENAARFRAWLR
jgi:hypothetical protein